MYLLAPDRFERTLKLAGTGSKSAPIEVHFAPGRYDFSPAKALRRKYNISNTNADPNGEKAIGILLENAKHVRIDGHGARIVFRVGTSLANVQCLSSPSPYWISASGIPTIQYHEVQRHRNRIYANQKLDADEAIKTEDCSEVVIETNQYLLGSPSRLAAATA